MIGRPLDKLICLILLSSVCVRQAQAQSLTPNPLQQLQQMSGQRGGGSTQGISPQTVILEPNAAPNPQLPTSRLEQILSSRAGVKLKQFGYDQLGVGRSVTLPQMGAVQDNYVLGPGDEIVVSLRGQENAEYRATVDRDGTVALPRMYPLSASGRTLGDFRRELVTAIHRTYISTEGFVSVGQVRQINVLVSGEVNSPGTRILTGLSTALDAILVSGGIKKSGSLRNIRVLHAGHLIPLDLYSVLTGRAQSAQVALSDGDKIIVPPMGPAVAIVGWVRRPGIYELAGGKTSIGAEQLFSLAGGLEVRGKYRISILEVAADGRGQMRPLEGEHATVRDSDIVFVQPAASQTVGKLTLSGGGELAGQYSSRNTKLSEILKSPGALGENPYTLFGVISRRDPVTLMRVLFPFTPVAVLKGGDDMNVQSDDIVRVMSAKEAQLLFLTVRQYEARRSRVEDALRSPEDIFKPIIETPANKQVGQTSVPPSAQQGTVEMNDSHQDLGSETEAESLRHVELEIERAARKANGQYFYGLSKDPRMGAASDAAQYPGALQQGVVGPQGSYARSDLSGVQGLPLDMQQGGQYSPQDTNQAAEQLEPYRDSEQSQAVGSASTNQKVSKISQLANQLEVDPVVLINFLCDHQVTVGGAVHGAGLYLVGPDADINSLLQAAGGLLRWADRNSIEVMSTLVDSASGTSKTQRNAVSLADAGAAEYIVRPRDEVRVNQIVTDAGIGQITVQGQVRNAGSYQIVRGEHLSDLLARAGGVTPNAYPYGTVFLRRSVAAQEKDAFRREADEIEAQLLIAMGRREASSKLAPESFTAVQGYVDQIRSQKPLGRVTIAADPAVLAAHPAMDPLLEPGDVVFVPQRPYSISVLGAVLQPGSIPYSSDMSASDYIGRAGGYSQFADSSQIVLVLPDGSARRVGTSYFGLKFTSDDIPPGSTIFVARDISGFDLHSLLIDTTTIFSQLAQSAAALAILSKQN